MTNDHRNSVGARNRTGWGLLASALATIGLCVGLGGLALAGRTYSRHYSGRIYPGVSVFGVDLSGLTVDEAAAALRSGLPDPATLLLVLRDGERVWSRSWANIGFRFDPSATARLAYQMGRSGTVTQQWAVPLQALFFGIRRSPVVVLPDPAQAAAALEALAPEVAVPPVNAALIIRPDGVLPVPAQAGRELDVEATVAVLHHAVGAGPEGLMMELLTRQVEPAIGNPGPAQAQAEALLAHPFTFVANDPLTDFSATWTVEPKVVAGWLIAQAVEPTEDEDDARLVLTVREEAVLAYLEGLGSQLADDVMLDIRGTLPAVRAAIEAGESQAVVALAHLPRTYTVQPGDTLMSVARGHSFPVWRLTEANPGIEPGELRPGQQILIPPVDVLFPLPPITDRRIVIDISNQRLSAYEGETPVFDFVCSTGIASSPTITGTFQVLSKEEEAYASSWDLWMPHFIGIYRSGPDFTNGIHALPTLSSGVRLWEGYLGRPVSYGCIVIGLDEAAALYDWAELGTLVVIQD
ncbi:MAG: L,D-transpeptidase family protein [Anaerolineae bacterium]|nr:MAG: L,D-transpeptidase family protein [Anaerolineae bacterium]